MKRNCCCRAAESRPQNSAGKRREKRFKTISKQCHRCILLSSFYFFLFFSSLFLQNNKIKSSRTDRSNINKNTKKRIVKRCRVAPRYTGALVTLSPSLHISLRARRYGGEGKSKNTKRSKLKEKNKNKRITIGITTSLKRKRQVEVAALGFIFHSWHFGTDRLSFLFFNNTLPQGRNGRQGHRRR